MKKLSITIIFLLLSTIVLGQKSKLNKPFSTKNKIVTVYTSADQTKLRLTKTDELNFTEKRQPPENEISIFVNPNKTFQTFLGIGGAITDASAEVFAKSIES